MFQSSKGKKRRLAWAETLFLYKLSKTLLPQEIQRNEIIFVRSRYSNQIFTQTKNILCPKNNWNDTSPLVEQHLTENFHTIPFVKFLKVQIIQVKI